MAVSRPLRVAVLMACHNRRATTEACLRALRGQLLPAAVELQLYVLDDASTDGTSEMVAREFPSAHLFRGNGQMYWCGGMRYVWAAALERRHDHYLWLNDDTHLYPDAVARMLDTWRARRGVAGRDVIVSGTTQDPATGRTTYGGVIRFNVVDPGEAPRRCDTTCGNCVLVPASVANTVGNLSSSFTHQLGDFDYGLRAAQAGIECWIAPGYIGTCSQHALGGSHLDAGVPMSDRLRMMRKPAGPPPLGEWMVFTYRHLGWRWPFYWSRSLVRACVPTLWLAVRSRRVERQARR